MPLRLDTPLPAVIWSGTCGHFFRRAGQPIIRPAAHCTPAAAGVATGGTMSRALVRQLVAAQHRTFAASATPRPLVSIVCGLLVDIRVASRPCRALPSQLQTADDREFGSNPIRFCPTATSPAAFGS